MVKHVDFKIIKASFFEYSIIAVLAMWLYATHILCPFVSLVKGLRLIFKKHVEHRLLSAILPLAVISVVMLSNEFIKKEMLALNWLQGKRDNSKDQNICFAFKRCGWFQAL